MKAGFKGALSGKSLFLAALAIASLASMYVGISAAIGDARAMAARWQIMQWQKGKAPPKAVQLGMAKKELQAALAWVPEDPQINESIAYLFRVRANAARGIPELEQGMWREAAEHYRAALGQRPMSPYAWANLAFSLHRLGNDETAMWQAYDRAFRYGQREKGVQLILAALAFERWDEAGGERRDALSELVRNALPDSRKDLLATAAKYGKESLFDDLQP